MFSFVNIENGGACTTFWWQLLVGNWQYQLWLEGRNLRGEVDRWMGTQSTRFSLGWFELFHLKHLRSSIFTFHFYICNLAHQLSLQCRVKNFIKTQQQQNFHPRHVIVWTPFVFSLQKEQETNCLPWKWIEQNNLVGGKKGNRTEPNRTTGLYRTEPTEISDSCGTGFYRRHRTEPANAMCLVPI